MSKNRGGGGNSTKGIFVEKTNEINKRNNEIIEKYEKIIEDNKNNEKIQDILNKTYQIYNESENELQKSIYNYTNDNYSEINKSLREGNTLEPNLKYSINNIDKMIDKMPKHEQVYFRHLEFTSDENKKNFENFHKIGNVVKYSAYSSASRERGRFNFDSKEDNSIRLFMHGKAILVEKFSEYSSEKEGIFKRNSNFLIEATRMVDGVREIYMRQL